MGKLLNILKTAPYIDPIQDQEEVKQDYRYWRVRIFYSMFIGYAFFYFTRKSFTFAMPGLIQDLGFTKGELGMLGTILYLSYGLSKFASGIMSDRSNPRYFMSIGLIITGICNILFGLSSSLILFALFWGINGWFQGWGWPPVARLLTHWYSHNERGSWWSAWNISHNIGGALIPFIAAASLYYYGWRYAMYIPGVLCIGIGLFLANRLRDTPQSLGLPAIEKFRDDYGGTNKESVETEHEFSTKQILFDFVLKNKYIWMLAIAYFFVYIVRVAINDWGALFLIESKGYSPIAAGAYISLFEVGGLVGSLAAGWGSDRLFGAKRGPVNVLFSLAMLGSTTFFWLIPAGYPWLDSAALFMIGASVFGPQMLIGIAAAELSHKKAAATATGFAGWFGYFGAAASGYPLGRITEDFGWDAFFLIMAISCIIATILLLPMWSVQSAKFESQKA